MVQARPFEDIRHASDTVGAAAKKTDVEWRQWLTEEGGG